jgi:transposase InsO family protein
VGVDGAAGDAEGAGDLFDSEGLRFVHLPGDGDFLRPRRGGAVKPWLTSVIDDGTRALLGWAITLTPSTATVLTALRMALTHDERRGPFGAVPAGTRIDRGGVRRSGC